MLTVSGRLVNRSLNDRGQMATMGEMTVLADPPAGRPDVAVVRQPIADDRHTVIGQPGAPPARPRASAPVEPPTAASVGARRKPGAIPARTRDDRVLIRHTLVTIAC
jgi:hypothetical protein